MFDRFYRAPTARAMPGSGLGLAIVRNAALAHGGTVTAAAAAGRWHGDAAPPPGATHAARPRRRGPRRRDDPVAAHLNPAPVPTAGGSEQVFATLEAGGAAPDLPPRHRPATLDPERRRQRTWLDDRSWIDFAAGWMRGGDTLLVELVESMPWQQGRRWMYDRMVDDPRLTSHGNGRRTHDPPALVRARSALATRYGVPIGGPGYNYYRDGRDSVAPHSDRELRRARRHARRDPHARGAAPVPDSTQGRWHLTRPRARRPATCSSWVVRRSSTGSTRSRRWRAPGLASRSRGAGRRGSGTHLARWSEARRRARLPGDSQP